MSITAATDSGPTRFSTGDSFADAPPVPEGTHGPYEITEGEEHFFSVDLDEGERLTTTIDFEHGAGDLDLAVYGPEETELGDGTSITDDETVEVTASESGTHYIKPYGFASASNEYDLEVTIDSA